ncbi:hypothetical protein HanLR1_Chr13g0500031 [Helianthus annuus]|nr:hypothetical protein HanLR1_Chr13g0500031 [Helianthus annuus]
MLHCFGIIPKSPTIEMKINTYKPTNLENEHKPIDGVPYLGDKRLLCPLWCHEKI